MIENQLGIWKRALRTVRLFFSSEVRWSAILWSSLLLTLLVSTSSLNVVNSYVGRDFMTAISDRRWHQFVTYAFIYAGVFAISTIISSFYRFSEERLRLLWRAWLTDLLIGRYMSRDTFYRLKIRDEVDNPDERITEDVKSYTQMTLSFFLMSQSALVTSLAFLGVLWSITPWLVLVAIIYAASGTELTIFLGRKLVKLNNRQLQKEADLRFHLIQTRETAEAIATMGASRMVRECLSDRLDDVVENNKRIIAVSRNLGLFTNGYNYLIQIIPILIVAPMYMRGEVDFGVVTQSAMAFSAFLGAFSLIVTQFETLSTFAAVADRLNTIALAIDQARIPAPSAIQIVTEESRVAFEGVTLWTPHERRPLIGGLSLSIPHGTNLLITGPDATAETALFLATAGLWENGQGRIIRPGSNAIYFVPKQSLAVRCTLRAQLVVPAARRALSDHEILEALEELGLQPMVQRVGGLDADLHGPSALSPSEQRLLMLARVLLAAPRFVFLDRMGGDLNREQVADVYRLFREASISYLSIGDSHGLLAYHDTVLEIQGEGNWQVEPAGGLDAIDDHHSPQLLSDPTGGHA